MKPYKRKQKTLTRCVLDLRDGASSALWYHMFDCKTCWMAYGEMLRNLPPDKHKWAFCMIGESFLKSHCQHCWNNYQELKLERRTKNQVTVHVSKDVKPETLQALGKMVTLAQEAIEEGEL